MVDRIFLRIANVFLAILGWITATGIRIDIWSAKMCGLQPTLERYLEIYDAKHKVD